MRPQTDDLFVRLESALREAGAKTRTPAPDAASMEAVKRVNEELRKRCLRVMARARVLLAAERRARRVAQEALANADHADFTESRKTAVDLLLRLSEERKEWKAALVLVRRALRRLIPTSKRVIGRVNEMERELEGSEATAVNLLVELSRQEHHVVADRVSKRSGPRKAPKVG